MMNKSNNWDDFIETELSNSLGALEFTVVRIWKSMGKGNGTSGFGYTSKPSFLL